MTKPLLDIMKLCWPNDRMYDRQIEIVRSVEKFRNTTVPAGNMLGKDWITARICLAYFLSRKPCRIVTSSVDEGQLEKVLWGEIKAAIDSSVVRLPLVVNHCDIRMVDKYGQEIPKTYLIGRVAAKEEGLLGHHLPKGSMGEPRTLMVYDEGSGIPKGFKDKTDTWAHRSLTIGNPYECDNHFRDLTRKGVQGEYSNVIRIKATDSPNVKFALAEIAAGLPVSHMEIIPGLLSYLEYVERRKYWDKILQCVSLDAEFYEGPELKLFPKEWLDKAELDFLTVRLKPRIAKAMGVDTAEGGDSTVWTVIDEFGVIEQLSIKTSDTNQIYGITIDMIKKHKLNAIDVWFDRGGGGQEHADRLRANKFMVNTVGFGESATPAVEPGKTTIKETIEDRETRYTYKNRRAEMYGMAREWMNPDNGKIFVIPPDYVELRRQLSLMPLKYDGEGRRFLPPKNKRTSDSNEITLTDIIGNSPDEADSLVVAVFGYRRRMERRMVHSMSA